MSLFSRRTIQHCLDENASFLTIEQQDRHSHLLNQGNRQSIASEWEVILLCAFSAIGRVVHEAKFKGSRKPDLHLSELRLELVDPPDADATGPSFWQNIRALVVRILCLLSLRPPEHEFIADITTISDRAIDKDNPYEYFRSELGRQVRKRGGTLGGFDIQVGGDVVGEDYDDRKMMLHLPRKKDIPNFITQHLAELITAVVCQPDSPHSTKVIREGIDITVNYSPRDRETVTGGYPVYNIPYSRTRNPLANALKKKAHQLRKTSYSGAKGIICCDGGCGVFAKRMDGQQHFGHREIVEHFLRNNTSIGFVALVWVADERWEWAKDRKREVIAVVYRSMVAEPKLSNTAYQLVKATMNSLPQPVRTATNAVGAVDSERRHGGASFYGGWSMAGQEIKLSSRTLADLLAGRIDQQQFLKDHGSQTLNVGAFFERQLAEGRMITELGVESGEEQDDDWIVVRFGDPDPATSPFRGSRARES